MAFLTRWIKFGPVVLGLATGTAAIVLSVVQPPRPLVVTKEPPGMYQPHLVDLCDDEEAAEVFDGFTLEAHRTASGVDCDNPRALRYIGLTLGDGPKHYASLDLTRAKAWIAKEALRIRASFVATGDGRFGCRSRGPRQIPEDADRGSTVQADLDGDEKVDRLVTYSLRAPDSLWGYDEHLRAELAAGTVIDVVNDQVDVIRGFYGTSDLDGNGWDEVWYEPSTNKPGAISFLLLESCQLTTARDGTLPFLVHTYGGPGELTSVSCARGGVIVAVSQHHVKNAYGTGRDEEEGWHFRVRQLRGTRLMIVATGHGDDLAERSSEIDWDGGTSCWR